MISNSYWLDVRNPRLILYFLSLFFCPFFISVFLVHFLVDIYFPSVLVNFLFLFSLCITFHKLVFVD